MVRIAYQTLPPPPSVVAVSTSSKARPKSHSHKVCRSDGSTAARRSRQVFRPRMSDGEKAQQRKCKVGIAKVARMTKNAADGANSQSLGGRVTRGHAGQEKVCP